MGFSDFSFWFRFSECMLFGALVEEFGMVRALWSLRCSGLREFNIGALLITYTILGGSLFITIIYIPEPNLIITAPTFLQVPAGVDCCLLTQKLSMSTNFTMSGCSSMMVPLPHPVHSFLRNTGLFWDLVKGATFTTPLSAPKTQVRETTQDVCPKP